MRLHLLLQTMETSSATTEIAHIVPSNRSILSETRLTGAHFCRRHYGSANLMQLPPNAAILCKVMQNDGHWAVQGHHYWYRSKIHMQLPVSE